MIISKRKKPRAGRLGSKDMQKLREDVFARDGFRCQHIIVSRFDMAEELDRYELSMISNVCPREIRCGKPVTWETGHLCHIVSRGAGGPDSAENTYCGCAECHLKFHQVGPSMTKPVPRKVKV